MISKKLNLDKIRQIFLFGFIFTIPNSVALNNIFLVLILFYWLVWGNKKETLYLIKTNSIVICSLIFFLVHIIGLLWTENIQWGLTVILRERYFLLLPILMSLIKNNEKDLLIKTFILSMSFSEIISYLIKFGILPEMFHATRYEPVPFIIHIHYSPFVAFSIYLLIYFLFIKKSNNNFIKYLSMFFIITMTTNLFLTGGRAGQVVFFILMIVFFIQYFKLSFKTFFLISIGLPLIFFIYYNNSKIFKDRVNQTFFSLKHIESYRQTSLGQRYTFAQNSIKIIKDNFLFGVGTGDFVDEYKKINRIYTPDIRVPGQPHNMYLLVCAQNGIIGLFVFLFLIFCIFRYSIIINDKYKFIRIGFIIYFIFLMFSDSYLFSHYGAVMFISFLAILYKDINYKKNLN